MACLITPKYDCMSNARLFHFSRYSVFCLYTIALTFFVHFLTNRMQLNSFILSVLLLSTAAFASLNDATEDSIASDNDWRFASSSDICNRTSHMISNLADLKQLAQCTVVAGDIIIENFKEPIMHLGNMHNILGSLFVKKSTSLVRMEAPQLESIGQIFGLKQLTSLSLISFPNLRHVQRLDWQVIPILSNINFSGTIDGLRSVRISDTSLTSISGFMGKEFSIFDINNNRFLELITTNVEAITESLHISANAANTIVSLPKLQFAQNVSINDVQQLDLTELANVGASASLIGNHFRSLKLPKLKSVKGTLSLIKNNNLNHIDFVSLSDIGGGLLVANNSLIEHVNFLPKLSVIGGAIELVGNFKEATMKQLRLVKGSVNVRSFSASFVVPDGAPPKWLL